MAVRGFWRDVQGVWVWERLTISPGVASASANSRAPALPRSLFPTSSAVRWDAAERFHLRMLDAVTSFMLMERVERGWWERRWPTDAAHSSSISAEIEEWGCGS